MKTVWHIYSWKIYQTIRKIKHPRWMEVGPDGIGAYVVLVHCVKNIIVDNISDIRTIVILAISANYWAKHAGFSTSARFCRSLFCICTQSIWANLPELVSVTLVSAPIHGGCDASSTPRVSDNFRASLHLWPNPIFNLKIEIGSYHRLPVTNYLSFVVVPIIRIGDYYLQLAVDMDLIYLLTGQSTRSWKTSRQR